MMILLIYSATYVPFETAFIENPSASAAVFEMIVTVYFICDVLINFISAYETNDKNIEFRFSQIAQNYLYSWFLLDAFSCVPF